MEMHQFQSASAGVVCSPAMNRGADSDLMSNHQAISRLELHLLGTPKIHLAGNVVERLPAKTQALLFYLAMTRQSHLRTALAHLLWSELSEPNARANLRKAIQHLRATLPDHFYSDRHSANLHGNGALWVDALAFAEQVAQAQKTADVGALEKAIRHYRDDFLAGFLVPNAPEFDAWQVAQRDHLHNKMLEALETLANQWAARHEFARAIGVTRRLLELEPWREEAHRQLMRLLAQNGQRDAALMQYERCRQALHAELAVEPGAETTTLHEQIRVDKFDLDTEGHSPAIPVSPSRHNLPVPTTSLLSRAAEIAQLLQLFADPNQRLVSIVAPGGMGKSHLAIVVATALLPHYADGVYFVALAPLTEAETLVPTIAASLGYTFQTDGRVPQAQLLDYLRSKELLLLLDNAEHLPAAVPLFTAILQAAPKVHLLVTSRERLRLNSETAFALAGLALSGEGNAQRSAAADLFVQTAQRVRPTFEPTNAEWAAIQEICQLVGGMPLGLILAASWVELLSPTEIATEISRSLDFLAAEMHDMPERHHSLRAVFATTWQRLSTEERTVFQKLAVFRGGFTREAAERVADASLATLTALKHKALIQTQPDGRNAIHELLRQFALDTLADLTDIRDKHSAYYCAFLAQRDGDLKGARQQAAMVEIEADSENIRTAWAWAARTQQLEQLIKGLDSLGLFYLWQSRLNEGEVLCQFALEQSTPTLPVTDLYNDKPVTTSLIHGGRDRQINFPTIVQMRLVIRLSIWRSMFQRNLKQIEAARDTLQQAQQWLACLMLVNSDKRLEQALLWLEEVEVNFQINHEKSKVLIEQSLLLLRSFNQQWYTAKGLELLGRILQPLGLLERARQITEESLTLRQQMGDIRGVADSLKTLSNVARWSGQFEEAIELIRQSIVIFAELNDRGQQAMATHTLAGVLVHGGHFEESLQLFEESMTIHQRLGLPGEPGHPTIVSGFALMHLGRYDEAMARHQKALSLYSHAENGYPLKNLGRTALVWEEYEKAQHYLAEALTVFRNKGDMNGHGQTLGCLGFLALRQQNLPQAKAYICENLQLAAETRLFLPNMTALAGVALLRATSGDHADAIELYTFALQHGHVANSRWYYDVIGRQIDVLAEKLPTEIVAAARVRGRDRDWRTAIQELWAEVGGR